MEYFDSEVHIIAYCRHLESVYREVTNKNNFTDDTGAQKDIVLDISKNRDANAEIILKKYEEKIPDSEIIDEANFVANDGNVAGEKQCNCFHGKKTDMLETQVKELRSKVEQDSNTSKYIIGLSLMFYFCICVYYWFHTYF